MKIYQTRKPTKINQHRKICKIADIKNENTNHKTNEIYPNLESMKINQN